MNEYWLTFRIEAVKVGGVTSDERRQALYDTINRTAITWWLEPTSFVMFSSTDSINDIADACKKAISPAYDLVLLRELHTKSARAIGKFEYLDTLKAFMPYVTKV